MLLLLFEFCMLEMKTILIRNMNRAINKIMFLILESSIYQIILNILIEIHSSVSIYIMLGMQNILARKEFLSSYE